MTERRFLGPRVSFNVEVGKYHGHVISTLSQHPSLQGGTSHLTAQTQELSSWLLSPSPVNVDCIL